MKPSAPDQISTLSRQKFLEPQYDQTAPMVLLVTPVLLARMEEMVGVTVSEGGGKPIRVVPAVTEAVGKVAAIAGESGSPVLELAPVLEGLALASSRPVVLELGSKLESDSVCIFCYLLPDGLLLAERRSP